MRWSATIESSNSSSLRCSRCRSWEPPNASFVAFFVQPPSSREVARVDGEHERLLGVAARQRAIIGGTVGLGQLRADPCVRIGLRRPAAVQRRDPVAELLLVLLVAHVRLPGQGGLLSDRIGRDVLEALGLHAGRDRVLDLRRGRGDALAREPELILDRAAGRRRLPLPMASPSSRWLHRSRRRAPGRRSPWARSADALRDGVVCMVCRPFVQWSVCRRHVPARSASTGSMRAARSAG